MYVHIVHICILSVLYVCLYSFCHNELLGRELSLGYRVFHAQSLFPLVYNICPFYLNTGILYKWNGKKKKNGTAHTEQKNLNQTLDEVRRLSHPKSLQTASNCFLLFLCSWSAIPFWAEKVYPITLKLKATCRFGIRKEIFKFLSKLVVNVFWNHSLIV